MLMVRKTDAACRRTSICPTCQQLQADIAKAKEKYFIERDERLKLEADKEIQATELRGKINEISVLSAKIRKLRRQPRSKKEGKK